MTDGAAALTVLVQSEGHPRIIERLLAVVASRAHAVTGVRSFQIAEESAPWLLLSMHGLPTLAQSLLERMASLPHVLTLSRVTPIDRPMTPKPPEVRVESLLSGFRVWIGERYEDATTPEIGIAKLLVPRGASSIGVLTDDGIEGIRVIGCFRTENGMWAAGATGPDGVSAAITVFDVLASATVATRGVDEVLGVVP